MTIDEVLNAYKIEVSDIPLIEYNNIFVANRMWLQRGVENDIATYDLVVREMPPQWNYYLMSGMDRMIAYILSYRFDEDAIQNLKDCGFITDKKAEDFYRNFKFSGEIQTLKDGTVFFPGEPIVRITAPVGEANLITAFMLNILSYPIRLLTKTHRVKLACGDKLFAAGSTVRLPGFEQGIWNARDAYLLGSPVYGPLFYRKFQAHKSSGKFSANINHAVIKSFKIEEEAFGYVFDKMLKDADHFYVMVDTYDFKKGVNTFIEEIKKRPNLPKEKLLVTIDSGDLAERAIYTRNELDKAGLPAVRINVMSNLNEYTIDKLVKGGVPIDAYFAGTELSNITDNPKLEVVYKMAELRKTDGTIENKAKLAVGKISYPGRKQIFRVYDSAGKMKEDIIGLEDEKLGEPLLQKVVVDGKLISDFPNLDEIKNYLNDELAKLPETYKDVNQEKAYPVKPSEKLLELLAKVKSEHE